MLLRDCEEGAYLVRQSSSEKISDRISINNNYLTNLTLCVVKGSAIKSIKIYYDVENRLHDIDRPCRFDSIQNLINHYKTISLSEFNKNLDVKLTLCVSKFEYGKTNEWNISHLYSSYFNAYYLYENLNRKSTGLQVEIDTLCEDLINKNLAISSFHKIINLYNEQLKICGSNLKPSSLSNETNTIVARNKSALESRISELHSKKQELCVDCEYLNIIIQQLKDELEQLRPELIELRKKKDNYHICLLERGQNEERIIQNVNMMKTSESGSSLENNCNLFENSINWYSTTCDRTEAITLLKNKPNGTFLVRPSKQSKYVLSLSFENDVVHIRIYEDELSHDCFIKLSAKDDKGVVIDRKFKTLTNLIIYFSTNDLKTFNQNLNTVLKYPAFLQQEPDKQNL